VVRVSGREYVVAKDRQLGTPSFQLMENYVGESDMEATLEVFRKAPRKAAPVDPRSTSELVRPFSIDYRWLLYFRVEKNVLADTKNSRKTTT
jgi:hypothetical protein